MTPSFARRWPWLLLAAGRVLALGFALTDRNLEARERGLLVRVGTSCVTLPVALAPPRSPTHLECVAGLIAGLEVLLAGICVLTHMSGRFPGRLLWRRDGGFGRLLWSTLLVAGVALQAWMIHRFVSARDPEWILWMSALAPTFVIPLIALTGCYRAKPALTPV